MNDVQNRHAGFTLVEMIAVIVITGIIGGMVAIFLRVPVQGYIDSARRAELTDIADTALRRMARDVRTAVPNSVRFSNCTAPCVEFLPTKDGGRYRGGTGGNNNILLFSTSNSVCPAVTSKFDIIGNAMAVTANTDFIVVGNTQSSGAPAYDQTCAGVLRKVTAMSNVNTTITLASPALPAWAELSSRRFDVVDGTQQAVTYACEGGAGTDANGDGRGQLKRYWNYGFNVAPGVHSAILADKLSACTIDYDVSNKRFGLLAVRLTLTSSNESVSLYEEIHVDNEP